MLFNSTIIAEGRGSIGGLTFSRNGAGQYIRQRAIPVNPNTALQQASRAIFQLVTERWSGVLDDVQRAFWNQYAAVVTVRNKLGENINISGFDMYVRSNAAILAAGLPIVDDGPTDLTLPPIASLFAATISEATGDISVGFDALADWANEDDAGMLVSMSIPQPGGRSFLSPQKRIAGVILGDSTTAPTDPTTIAAPFGVAAGQKVIVSARILRADGRVSNTFRVTVTIAA